MNDAAKDAPITLKPKFVLADVDKVTIMNMVNDEKKKATLYCLTDADPELLLRLVSDFNDMMPRLHLNTGPLVYEKFRECLAGTARDMFDLAREGHANSIAGFAQSLAAFIEEVLEEADLEEQKDYLQSTKKPYKWTVSEYAARLRYIVSLMKNFPGAEGEIYSATALKYMLYNAMPQHFKDEFQNSTSTIASMSWAKLVRYFENCRNQDLRNNRKNAKNKRPSLDHSDEEEDLPINSPTKKSKTHSNGTSDELPKDCPWHIGQHAWLNCYGNPKGPKYKPGFVLHGEPQVRRGASNGSQNRFGTTNSRNGADAHMLEASGNSSRKKTSQQSKRDSEGTDQHYFEMLAEMQEP